MLGRGQQGFRPTHEVRASINEILLDIQDARTEISRGYFEDLFLMLSRLEDRERTATEIQVRREEKLLALGPVLEQINEDMLDPMIENTFNFGMEQGQFPEPPEELSGVELKVEYVSIMAKAQKSIGLGALERFTNYVATVANAKQDPSVWLQFDHKDAIEDYAVRAGVDVDVVVPRAEVEAQEKLIREAQAQAIQSEQLSNSMDSLQKGARGAKDLAAATQERQS